jgi:hypothetical protein
LIEVDAADDIFIEVDEDDFESADENNDEEDTSS